MYKRLIHDLKKSNFYVTKYKIDNIIVSRPWDIESAARIIYAIETAQNLLNPALIFDFYKTPDSILVKMILATNSVIDSILELQDFITDDNRNINEVDSLIANLEHQVKNLFPAYFPWLPFFKKRKNKQTLNSHNKGTTAELKQLKKYISIMRKELHDVRYCIKYQNKELMSVVKETRDTLSIHNEKTVIEFLHEDLFVLENENVDDANHIDGEYIKDWLSHS